MKGIFSYDGFLNQTINKLIDAVCLNILWFLFSVPVITIGAASTAMYYTFHKVIRRREGYLFQEFWRSFKQNVKQTIPVWLLIFVIYLILLINGYLSYVFYINDVVPLGILIVILVVTALVMIWSSYLFPYLGRFNDTSKTAAKNSMYMMAMHIPASVALLAVSLGTIGIVICLPMGLLYAPGICVWLQNLILEPIFRKYIEANPLSDEAD